MAYIYKITNQINNKVYIGKTEDTIEKRFKEHCKASTKTKEKHRPLYAAMKKYGVENFTVELIEKVKLEDSLEERECYWIDYFNSFKEGYNATRGGDGRHYADYELIFNLYSKENKTCNEIHEITKYDIATIRRALNHYGIDKEQRISDGYEKERQKKQRKVAKLDLKTEEIIEVYNSISEAERCNGNSRHISSVCNGKRKTCKGYKWKFLD